MSKNGREANDVKELDVPWNGVLENPQDQSPPSPPLCIVHPENLTVSPTTRTTE